MSCNNQSINALERAAQNMNHLAASGALPIGDTSPLALAAVLAHVAPQLSARGISCWISTAIADHRTRSAKQKRAHTTSCFGIQLSEADLARMHAEIRRFQWIEAERAGRNIWVERDALNPEAAATVEWFRRHFGAWYLHEKGSLPLRG